MIHGNKWGIAEQVEIVPTTDMSMLPTQDLFAARRNARANGKEKADN